MHVAFGLSGQRKETGKTFRILYPLLRDTIVNLILLVAVDTDKLYK